MYTSAGTTDIPPLPEQAGASWRESDVSDCRLKRHTLQADTIGDRVPRDFARGVVHSVFRMACNIELPGGTLVALLPAGTGNLPHSIRCRSAVAPGVQARVRPGQVVIGNAAGLEIPAARITVDLTEARAWSGAIGDLRIDRRSPRTLRSLITVRSLLAVHTRDGFAPILLQGSPSSSALAGALARQLASCLPRLAASTVALDAPAAALELGVLVGLGPGLTPSGDDFVVGYLAAMRARSRYEPGTDPFVAALRAPLQRLAAQTNPIGRQYILDATAGAFPERLVDVVHALTGSHADLCERVGRALATGHSSGGDTLAGLLFGMAPQLTMSRDALGVASAEAR